MPIAKISFHKTVNLPPTQLLVPHSAPGAAATRPICIGKHSKKHKDFVFKQLMQSKKLLFFLCAICQTFLLFWQTPALQLHKKIEQKIQKSMAFLCFCFTHEHGTIIQKLLQQLQQSMQQILCTATFSVCSFLLGCIESEFALIRQTHSQNCERHAKCSCWTGTQIQHNCLCKQAVTTDAGPLPFIQFISAHCQQLENTEKGRSGKERQLAKNDHWKFSMQSEPIFCVLQS